MEGYVCVRDWGRVCVKDGRSETGVLYKEGVVALELVVFALRGGRACVEAGALCLEGSPVAGAHPSAWSMPRSEARKRGTYLIREGRGGCA